MEEEHEIKIEYLESFDMDPLRELGSKVKAIEKSQLQNKDADVSSDGTNAKHPCLFCRLTYSTHQCLRHHIKLKHPDHHKRYKQMILRTKRRPQLKCHICSGKFKCIEELQHHVEKEHCLDAIRLSCFYCNAAFDSESEVREHLLVKHNKVINKICVCSVCGYRTFNKSNFNHHTISHSGRQNMKCSFCEYTTSHARNLKVHERIHTNLKSFQCNFEGCEYACNSEIALKSHKLRHDPEKVLLYCDKCNYSTIYKQSLTKHHVSHINNRIRR